MFSDANTIFVESIDHDGTHGKEVVYRSETAGRDVALNFNVSLRKIVASLRPANLVLDRRIATRWRKVLSHRDGGLECDKVVDEVRLLGCFGALGGRLGGRVFKISAVIPLRVLDTNSNGNFSW